MVAPGDSLVGGSVEEAVDKLASLPDAIGITRFVGQIDIGGQPFHNVANGIELLATRVAPRLARSAPNPGTTLLPSAGPPPARPRTPLPGYPEKVTAAGDTRTWENA